MNTKYEESSQLLSYRDIQYLLCSELTYVNDLDAAKESFNKLRSLGSENEAIDGQVVATQEIGNWIKAQEAIRIFNLGRTYFKDKPFNLDILGHYIDELQHIGNRVETDDTTPADIMNRIFEENGEEKIPTGIKEVDIALNGGHIRGTLGLLIAGTGVGKSTLSTIMCCNVALKGYKVLQIFFEDRPEDIGRKYYAHLTGRYTNEFNSKAQKEALKQEIWDSDPQAKEALTKRIKLRAMDNGSTTVEHIKAYVRHLIECENWRPDMIFIDYLSCLVGGSNKSYVNENEWAMFERMSKKLAAFAKEINAAIWIAQQTNRTGEGETDFETRGLSCIQGSYRIGQPCTTVLYLKKRKSDMKNNRASLCLEKARDGELKDWIDIYMNNGNCTIDLSDKLINDDDLELKEEDL